MTDNSATASTNPAHRVAESNVEVHLSGGGEMGALIRARNWSSTPLGPATSWPQSLRTALSMMLESRVGMGVAWGPDFRFFYNDRYRHVLGTTKHPGALGATAREVFPEAWSVLEPLFNLTRAGEAVSLDDVLIPLDRNGYLENCYFTLSYSPIRDESGGVGGMLAVVVETTARVLSERRLTTLRDLARAASLATTLAGACEAAARTFEQNTDAVPFSLVYLVDPEGRNAALVGSSGLEPGTAASPLRLDLAADGPSGWPVGRATVSRTLELVSDLADRFGPLPGGPFPEPTHSAVVVPLVRPGKDRPWGILIAGVSPRRAFDDAYSVFFDLAAEHLVTAITNAQMLEEEHKRAAALAELDLAKTTFFSNISHEFRTPLTLMLGPLQDSLADSRDPLSPMQRERLELVDRNGRRLRTMVDALLDFARLEAGRHQASTEPTDLAQYTADLASSFRSAVESAGLSFEVDCPPLAQPVEVDPSMWEKIVLNLLSNAFKFTFAGGIKIRLRGDAERVVLTVQDTGTGIPAEELPRLFERFHRVKGAQGRIHGGTGIGLALVHELVKLHGGTIEARSALGAGTTFSVAIPVQAAPSNAPSRDSAEFGPPSRRPSSFGIEPWRRFQSSAALIQAAPVDSGRVSTVPGRRVLVVDDNADMRSYLTRLLSEHWAVDVASDGAEALGAALANPPDLVLSDVMMPVLDGLGLVRALRGDARTRTLPVVLLAARAGEEATVAALKAGADDYLVKPFSANELLARVRSQFTMAALRQEALQHARAHTEELARSNSELEQFAYVSSHDLQEPLRAISGFAQLLSRRYKSKLDADADRFIDHVVNGAQRMQQVINDLLAFSRVGTVARQAAEIRLDDALAHALTVLGPAIEEAKVRVTHDPLPVVLGDDGQLTQLFTNLIGNAIKFRRLDVPSRIHVSARAAGSFHEIAIQDNGIGIEEQYFEQIFVIFQRLHAAAAYPGTGIGLAICKKIVERFGGTLSVASVPGEGATFTFTVPVPPEPPATSTQPGPGEVY